MIEVTGEGPPAPSLADDGSGSLEATADHSARLALAVFVAYLAAGWWLLIFRLGSHAWFLRDDWMFLAGRDGGSLEDVFRPHDVHPAAIPVVVFRIMFNLFGLWFTPYLVLIVSLHLGVVVLLRVVMRRAGVGPWVATAAAGMLVLFGPGGENIHWAFQINFVGSLLFGLTHLILADHDGPLRCRDAIGALAGVASVMCSGVGPLMVAAVGVAALARRGWRVALLHVAAPALAYVSWALITHPAAYDFGRPPPSVVWDWAREGQTGVIDALGHGAVVAVLLLVILGTGLGLLVSTTPLAELRRRAAAPLALLLCGPLLFLLVVQGRWVFGLDQARSSRYLHIGAVCLLPALALAGDALARRWRSATAIVVVVLLLGVPGNVGEFGTQPYLDDEYLTRQRQIVLSLPRVPEADQVPRWVRPLPDPYNGEDLTIGWLLDALEAGRLPEAAGVDPSLRAKLPILLGLAQVDQAAGDECETYTKSVVLSLAKGDRLGIRSAVNVALVVEGKRASGWADFYAANGETLSVELPLDVRITSQGSDGSFTLCS